MFAFANMLIICTYLAHGLGKCISTYKESVNCSFFVTNKVGLIA